IKETSNLGIKSLIEVTGLNDKKISSGHVGFIIGPRINAAGRMESASLGVELFTSTDYENALEISKKLDEENKNRQMVEAEILEKAEKMVEKHDMANDNIIVLASRDWHSGVIGIVSSRITEKYHRPSILISIDDKGIGKASARSIGPLNIYDALKECKDLFLGFGGHSQAAGLSIEQENITLFKEKINNIVGNMLDDEDFIKEVKIDAIVEAEDISISTVNILENLSPFGMGNSSPVFLFEDAIVKDIRAVGKDKSHLKLSVIYKGIEIDSIGFNLGHLAYEIEHTDIINIIGSLDINEYMNKKTVQIITRDIIINSKKNKYFENKYFENVFENISSKVEKYNKNIVLNNTNINKIDYLYDKILEAKKIKIYINDLDNLNLLMKRIDKSGRDIFKKIEIIINPTKNEIINNNKKTILYDLPIDKEIYDIMRNIHPDIEVLSCEYDLKNNIDNIEKWTPNIKELRFIYKTFMGNKEVFKLQIDKYINSLSDKNLNKMKIVFALKILKQTNLLDFKKIDSKNYYIKLIKTENKVDIKSSKLLRSLNDYVV
ncbi:single-stranded-DNA-specific exonuclease RecJ, partial [Senegalia sp. (in: firmicutes)]|uniref:single-stranded-DNA-specific exonuclease RecJ n=1 Tax=Senegalia sp. (in: firmicutes) TaxID=1924098 RepID=UPI003F952585